MQVQSHHAFVHFGKGNRWATQNQPSNGPGLSAALGAQATMARELHATQAEPTPTKGSHPKGSTAKDIIEWLQLTPSRQPALKNVGFVYTSEPEPKAKQIRFDEIITGGNTEMQSRLAAKVANMKPANTKEFLIEVSHDSYADSGSKKVRVRLRQRTHSEMNSVPTIDEIMKSN
jgi:hypothetical protein